MPALISSARPALRFNEASAGWAEEGAPGPTCCKSLVFPGGVERVPPFCGHRAARGRQTGPDAAYLAEDGPEARAQTFPAQIHRFRRSPVKNQDRSSDGVLSWSPRIRCWSAWAKPCTGRSRTGSPARTSRRCAAAGAESALLTGHRRRQRQPWTALSDPGAGGRPSGGIPARAGGGIASAAGGCRAGGGHADGSARYGTGHRCHGERGR